MHREVSGRGRLVFECGKEVIGFFDVCPLKSVKLLQDLRVLCLKVPVEYCIDYDPCGKP